jgi:hypothetical protein
MAKLEDLLKHLKTKAYRIDPKPLSFLHRGKYTTTSEKMQQKAIYKERC